MISLPTVLNLVGVHIKKDGIRSSIKFNIPWLIDLPECFDNEEYIVIRTKDLNQETRDKIHILLQGKFQTESKVKEWLNGKKGRS
jgi:hypothetical protein